MTEEHPEITRNRRLQEEVKDFIEPFTHATNPLPEDGEPPLDEEEDAVDGERLMKLMQQLPQHQQMRTPIPPQAEYTEYLIGTKPFKTERDDSGGVHIRDGDMPEHSLYFFHGGVSKHLILSNLTKQELKVVDLLNLRGELSRIYAMDESEFTPEFAAELDQKNIIDFCTVRRAKDGFATRQLTTQEQVSTLQTPGQVGYEKSRIRRILGGR